ncbi:hypothetical protein [Flavobacterium cerinum]|uniref:Uncharacterized protein n=1 Tax=Flavobacterium cerinum TaxID=2502784 RepID=A0A444GMV8_9FLAO|nr:hypothetical protein [Flavobacterium cerinum]RWW92293.1 hypothetical protein EPI11_15385 [Flavobacterium cerinum]
MEPNKLEKDFKKKLEQRTIQPTEMAWDRLDAMLSVTEKKKPNRTWMYMVASFLVFLLVGSLFLKQEKENNGNGIIKTEDAVVTVDHPVEAQIEQEDNQVTVPEIKNQDVITAPVRNQKAVAATTTKRVNAATNGKAVTIQNTVVVNKEALAVTDKKEPTVLLPAAETQNLIAAATNQTAGKSKSTVKVDPNSLLSSVEGELTDSYRSKTFQGVVKNFNAVKTAVANRNYE